MEAEAGGTVPEPAGPWPVDRLLLDRENPRLPEDLATADQTDLLLHFAREYQLEELAWSMAERGYFLEEPLLTISSEDPEYRVVIEGNRRLATLKLLRDPALRAVVPRRALWDELATAAARHNLDLVPTRNYPERRQLVEYLGFRHVSGLMAWESEAKARFIHKLITEYGYSFRDAGRVIGSRLDAIRRQFVAWRAIEQARTAGQDVASVVGHFGVFYRALQNPAIRSFLHLDGWSEGNEGLRDPLSNDGTERLAELVGYVFGPDRVIRDSRQLDDLARALNDRQALAVLRESRDLELALAELPLDRDRIFAALRLSYRHAARANGEAFQFSGDPELTAEAERLLAMVRQVLDTLREAPAAERETLQPASPEQNG